MATKLYKAKIVLKSGSIQEITVQADDPVKAKDLINMQYGNPKFFSNPQEVRR